LPAKARTSNAKIVAAARELLESSGVEAVTMAAVADKVGVKAPSLYKRIRDRGDLLRHVANEAALELATTLDAAVRGDDSAQDLERIAMAFRDWVHRSPAAYALLTSPVPETWRVDPELNVRMSAPIVNAARELAGPDAALDAARTFVAFAHGFVSLEGAGTFRLGGDPATAYRRGITALVRTMASDLD
jgi:AcrR family transcriptional regulator